MAKSQDDSGFGWDRYRTNHSGAASRVVLWPGSINSIPEEVDRLGCSRLMVLCGGSTRRSKLYVNVVERLGARVVTTVDDVAAHTPEDMVMASAAIALDAACDGFLAIGGGSASDCAKAISIVLAEGGHISEHASSFTPPDKFVPKELFKPKLPVIAIPTTASAAEVTPGLGVRSGNGKKMLFWDAKLASRLIVLDPEANVEVPASLMAQTAMNALAHCVEGLYSRLRSPISDALALQGIRILHREIPAMASDPASVDRRAGVLAGAHLSGLVISNARVGVHHAICHCLGARGGLGHGEANSIMLPHAMAYNIDVAASQLALAAEAMGVANPSVTDKVNATYAIEAVRRLQENAGVPMRLRDTKLDRSALDDVAVHTMFDRGLHFNPRSTSTIEPIVALLKAAW